MVYGILAVGLVLVYRSTRIINFAHGQIGAFGAALLGVAVVSWHVPYWVALPGAHRPPAFQPGRPSGDVGALRDPGLHAGARCRPRRLPTTRADGARHARH